MDMIVLVASPTVSWSGYHRVDNGHSRSVPSRRSNTSRSVPAGEPVLDSWVVEAGLWASAVAQTIEPALVFGIEPDVGQPGQRGQWVPV